MNRSINFDCLLNQLYLFYKWINVQLLEKLMTHQLAVNLTRVFGPDIIDSNPSKLGLEYFDRLYSSPGIRVMFGCISVVVCFASILVGLGFAPITDMIKSYACLNINNTAGNNML